MTPLPLPSKPGRYGEQPSQQPWKPDLVIHICKPSANSLGRQPGVGAELRGQGGAEGLTSSSPQALIIDQVQEQYVLASAGAEGQGN